MNKVIIKRMDRYDAEAIRNFTGEALALLDVKPKPRAFIKPNLVQATRYSEHAYTHPTVLQGVIKALKEYGVDDQTLFEDCGLTMPMRYVFRKSGYAKLCHEEGIRFLNLSEAVHDSFLSVPQAEVHTRLPFPYILTLDGLRVFVPKLKIHSQTDITGACKLMIGIIKRSVRLHRHHYDLDRKIVDALEAYQPDLVIVDGITVGLNGAGCPDPYHLGVVIASRNAVAADAVAAHLLGFNPCEIKHLRLASERGLGPSDIEGIEIIREGKIKPLKHGRFNEPEIDSLNPYIRYFEGEVHNDRRCRGGCIGFVAEAIHYLNHYRLWRQREKVNPAARSLYRLFGQEPSQERPREIGVVVGDYRAEIPERLRSSLVFVGDCTEAGKLKPRVHLRRCPVFMATIAFEIARAARLLNPYIDVMEGLPYIGAFLEEKFMKLWNVITYPVRRNA